MVIQLPREHKARRAAQDWLTGEGIKFLPLFQAVMIENEAHAERFKQWLDETSKSSSEN